MNPLFKLLGTCTLAGAMAVVSCGHDHESSQRAPRVIESSPELFERDEHETVPLAPEQTFREDTTQRAPTLPRPAPVRVKPSLAWLERAIAEANAREVEPPKEEAPIAEPSPPPSAVPPPPERHPPPVQIVDRRKLDERDARREAWRDATNVALALGAISAGVGAAASSTADGTPGDTAVSVTFLGIGLAGFATAGVLYLVDPTRTTDSKVMIGPTGIRGSF